MPCSIEDHDAGGGGDDFGETREIEDRVERHRFALRFNRARAVGFAPDNFSVTRDQHNRAGQFFLFDRSRDDRVHAREAFGGESLSGRKAAGS